MVQILGSFSSVIISQKMVFNVNACLSQHGGGYFYFLFDYTSPHKLMPNWSWTKCLWPWETCNIINLEKRQKCLTKSPTLHRPGLSLQPPLTRNKITLMDIQFQHFFYKRIEKHSMQYTAWIGQLPENEVFNDFDSISI